MNRINGLLLCALASSCAPKVQGLVEGLASANETNETPVAVVPQETPPPKTDLSRMIQFYRRECGINPQEVKRDEHGGWTVTYEVKSFPTDITNCVKPGGNPALMAGRKASLIFLEPVFKCQQPDSTTPWVFTCDQR